MNEEVAAEAEVVKDDEIVAEEVIEVEAGKADAEPDETKETEDGEAKAAEKDKEKEVDPKPSESSPEKKKDGAQKRIDEITRQKYDYQRESEYWKQIAQTNQVAPDPVESGKTLADFEYDEGKYTEYLKTTAAAEANATVDQRIHQENQARSKADFNIKEAEFAKDIDDYHIVTRQNLRAFTENMFEAVQSADDGPAVLYYLGKNPEVAERLANLPPLSMAREIGKIEANKLAKEKPPSVTKAPKPAPKLAAVDSKVTLSIDDANLTDAQFRKLREKQIANR